MPFTVQYSCLVVHVVCSAVPKSAIGKLARISAIAWARSAVDGA